MLTGREVAVHKNWKLKEKGSGKIRKKTVEFVMRIDTETVR